MHFGSRTIAGACLLLVGATGASAADFYAGKTIEIIVGSDVGGGYDIYARAIARHIGAPHPRQSRRSWSRTCRARAAARGRPTSHSSRPRTARRSRR